MRRPPIKKVTVLTDVNAWEFRKELAFRFREERDRIFTKGENPAAPPTPPPAWTARRGEHDTPVADLGVLTR